MQDKNLNAQESVNDMVNMAEVLKDDPDALKGLDEMKEWIDNTPEILDFINKEPSQGINKLKQLLEDIRRDTNFIAKLDEIVDTEPSYDYEELELLFALYVSYKLAVEKFREKYLTEDQQHKLRSYLCTNYGVDPKLLDFFVYSQKTNQLEGWDFTEQTSGDMCRINDDDETEIKDIHSFHTDIVEDLKKVVFPVTLSIHKYASKRDVIDFIEKNWKAEVEPFLEKKVIKSRKLPRRVIDFIWTHRDLKASEIASLTSDEYPEYTLAYYEINQVLSEEKKRRNVE